MGGMSYEEVMREAVSRARAALDAQLDARPAMHTCEVCGAVPVWCLASVRGDVVWFTMWRCALHTPAAAASG